MTCGAAVDRRLAPLTGLAEVPVDRDMRRNRPASQVVHKLRDVVCLVRTQSYAALAFSSIIVDEFERLVPLGGAGRLTDAAANRQAMAVLHQGMPHVAKLGRLSV